ncbi:MAG: hypothetical protein NVSMB22_25130 [Chloroflexota bacterium]
MAIDHMTLQPLSPAGDMAGKDSRTRASRWRFFRVAFILLYFGVVLDLVTTAIGFLKVGASYEQNPLTGSLIAHLGWFGVAGLLTVISWVLYKSFRTVFWHMSLKWSVFLNSVLVLMVVFRWVVVAGAVAFIVGG